MRLPVLFSFSPSPRWNTHEACVETRFSFGKQRGTMVVPLSTFERLARRQVKPAQCVGLYHRHVVLFERAAERAFKAGLAEPDGRLTLLRDDLPAF